MSVVHWLLNVVCFGVALVPGRGAALGLAHIDKLSPFITGPVTVAVMYLYSRTLMRAGDRLCQRVRECDSRLVRRILRFVDDDRNGQLSWLAKAVIVGGLSVLPAAGFWVAMAFAVILWSDQIGRAALTIGIANGLSLVAIQVFAGQMIPSAGHNLQPKLEIASYVVLGLFLVRQSYIRRAGLRLRVGGWVSPIRASIRPASNQA